MDFELRIENEDSRQAEVLRKLAPLTVVWDYAIVELEATFVTDGAYGADADGNRGVSRTELDDLWITSIKLYADSGTEAGSIEVATISPANISPDDYMLLTEDAEDAAEAEWERIN